MSSLSSLHQVAPAVHVWTPGVENAWGFANCGLVTSGTDALVIDTPYTPALTRAFLDAARQAAPGVGFDTVVTTHGNGDHTWGLQCLPGADVIATRSSLDHLCHEPTPQQLRALAEKTDPGTPLGWYFRKHFGIFDFSGIQVVPPTRTFDGRLDLTVGDIPVELYEVGPAHTVGDLIVHLPEQRVVFAGDIVFNGDHPSHWAGPLEAVSTACERILALDPEWIVPGHGPLLDQGGLREHIAYLDDLADHALLLHGQGKTPVKAAQILLNEGRYPGMGLPERLAITLAAEWRHLDGDTAAPDLVAVTEAAARIAWQRASAMEPTAQ
ncbi:MBL fold metallo-hydrolase [Streptomyces sp. NPDC056160]|uniref:MBL fold metallo-hydrolase n=1 Tax=Streptomyces sp. NPDC056160 TaxID=3345731 RepID=UPI0035E3829C